MNQLEINLLGTPEVHYQGRLLKFRSRRALALLAYLALEQRGHSREELIDLLWWEKGLKLGRTSLRVVLSQIRKALAAADAVVVASSDSVHFDAGQPHQLDVAEITHALSSNEVAVWEAALARSRGDLFAGFALTGAPHFERWVSVQREHWHQQIESLYEQVAAYWLDSGERSRAVDMASRWAAHSPLSDPAHHCLMQAQLLNGDRVAALQTYKQFTAILELELGITPQAEITALAEQIQENPHPFSHRKVVPQAITLASPFVGRDGDHRALVAAFERTLTQQTEVVLITGEPGIGKTHLVDTFLQWVETQPGQVDTLRARAHEMGGKLPYQPVVEALRARLDSENAPEDLLDDMWLAELSQLLPDLRSRYPDLPAATTGDADLMRARLFEAVTLLGAAIANRQPVLLFLDDMQWADSGALDLLNYAMHRWQELGVPILLLMTVRDYALLSDASLANWTTHLSRTLSVKQIHLSAFSEAETEQYLRQLARYGDEVDALTPLSQWLFSQCGGQPFYLKEIVQLLWEQRQLVTVAENGRLAIDLAASWNRLQNNPQNIIPPKIRDVVLARMQRLSESAMSLLMAAAALERQAQEQRLYQIANLEEADGLPALLELLNSGLLVEHGMEKRPYQFSHSTIREVAYTEAGEARRRLFHRRAFAGLEQDNAPPAELAFHALAARLDEPACRYAILAGEVAQIACAYNDALAHYDQARDIVPETPLAPSLLSQLYTQRGRTLELAHRFEEARDNYSDMLTLAGKRADPALRLAALIAYGALLVMPTRVADTEKGRQMITEALAMAQTSGDAAVEAKALWCMALLALREGKGDDAVHYSEASLAIARQHNLAEQIAFALNELRMGYGLQGSFGKILANLEELRWRWQALGNRPMLVEILAHSANHYFLAGDFERAGPVGEEAYQLAIEINNHWNIVPICLGMASIYREQGKIFEAFNALAIVIDGEDVSGLGRVVGSVLLGHLYHDMGQLSDALAHGRRGLVHLDTPTLPPYMIPALKTAISARLAIWEAEPSAIQTAFQAYTFDPADCLNQSKNLFAIATTLPCELALAAGEYETAVRYADAIIETIEPVGMHYGLPRLWHLQGLALQQLGDEAGAHLALKQAHTIAIEQKAQRISWQIGLDLADAEEQLGDKDVAGAYRQQALATRDYILEQIQEVERRAAL